MDLLLHLSSREGLGIARPLAAACDRAGIAWGCFVTNDGVEALSDAAFLDLLGRAHRAVVCEHSWGRFGTGDSPIERGSQTVNSGLMAEAQRVVSL